jgi:hypothetical protein
MPILEQVEERVVDFTLKVPLMYDPGTVLKLSNRYNNLHQIVLVKEVHFKLDGELTFSFDGKKKKEEEMLAYSRAEYTLISQPGSYFDYGEYCGFDEGAIAEEITSSNSSQRQRAFLKLIALRCVRRVFPGPGIPMCPGTCIDKDENELNDPKTEILSDFKELTPSSSSIEDFEKWIDRLVEGDEEAIKYRDQIEHFLH